MEDWRELVTASLKGQNFEFSRKLRDDTVVQPLYLKGDLDFQISQWSSDFYNILEVSSACWSSELLADSSAAMLFHGLEDFQKQDLTKIFFLSPALWPGLQNWEVLQSHIEKIQKINLGWDPWVKGLHEGKLFRWSGEEFSLKQSKLLDHEKVKAFRFSGEIYHLAGAHNIQELSILLATVVEALRNFSGEKSIEEIISHISFEITLTTDPFQSIAKLQALQILWQKLQKSLGINSQPVEIYGRASLRLLSRREPWNNIMRLTLMNFSALAGGARGFFHHPYDMFSRQVKDDGHIAQNISLILQKESGFSEVVMPALGSGYVDSLTEQYCEKAWSFFQEIEGKSGLLESLLSGWLQTEISLSHEAEVKDFLSGEKKMIGVNQFAGLKTLSDQYPFVSEVKDIETLWQGSAGEVDREKANEIQPLRPYQLSEVFEKWQYKSDKLLQKEGKRPSIAIFCQDDKAFKDRLKWLKNFLASGGIEVEKLNKDSEPSCSIAICLGYSPEEKEWAERLEKWQKQKLKEVFWFGEKSNSNFANTINMKTSALDFYDKVYRLFEELS